MQLVFVHGSGGCGAVWRYQSDFFRGSDAVDLPGHPDGELLPSVDDYVDWLKAYIDEKGYRKVVIVGHSIGGAIAMLYALKYPEDLEAIVPLGSGGRLRVLPQTLRGLKKAIDDPSLFSEMLRGIWEKVDPDVSGPLMERFEIIGPAAFLNDLRACDRFDIIGRLSEITTPTLAVCGTEDVMTPPKYSQFLADKIAGARAEIIQGGTHMVFLEKPDEVNQSIQGFLADL